MAGWQRETARSCLHFGVASEHRHSCLCAQRTFCRLCFFDFTAQCNCAGRTDCKSVFQLNHQGFRWRVGNAELFFHEIEVDRALRRAMLLKLLLGIASAVEESLTSQGRVALFFTSRAHVLSSRAQARDLAHCRRPDKPKSSYPQRAREVPRRLRDSG